MQFYMSRKEDHKQKNSIRNNLHIKIGLNLKILERSERIIRIHKHERATNDDESGNRNTEIRRKGNT